MDSVLALQPINLEITIYITTPHNAVWFCILPFYILCYYNILKFLYFKYL